MDHSAYSRERNHDRLQQDTSRMEKKTATGSVSQVVEEDMKFNDIPWVFVLIIMVFTLLFGMIGIWNDIP